jgi:hypothetical protein
MRTAMKNAIFRYEQRGLRVAYRKQADSAEEADSREIPEEQSAEG